jgi:hypothetical protein
MGDATAAAEPGATGRNGSTSSSSRWRSPKGNVRAYDIKAQISLAAFVLSGNPLMAIINGACGTSARQVLVIALVVFIATILTYLWVLWPVAAPQQN